MSVDNDRRHQAHSDDGNSRRADASDEAGSGGSDHVRDVDEQFRALLEGLRTSIPAVQVLFAFLLTVPFQTRFDALDDVERGAFALAFYAAGAASVLLVAPSVHQRFRAPMTGMERHSPRHLRWATWIGIAGSIAALVAVVATVFLVSAFVYGPIAVAVATSALAGLAVWSWVVVPLLHFRRQH